MTVVRLSAVAVLSTIALLLVFDRPTAYGAKAAPIKEVLVDELGKEGKGAGEFSFPVGVAGAPGGDIYVADTVNHRVQRFTASGEFISMFGQEVNQTKVEAVIAKGGTPTAGELEEENVCTAASGDKCQTGVEGGAPGALTSPQGIFTDSAGNVYVQEGKNKRIEKFTAEGKFVLMIGGKVNRTKQTNICTEAEVESMEKVECQAGVEDASNSIAGAFRFGRADGNRIAIGGSEELLYVGDGHRVQVFDPVTGAFLHEISLSTISVASQSDAVALALDNSCALQQPPLTKLTAPTCEESDPEDGDLYVIYDVEGSTNVVLKFDQNGAAVKNSSYPLILSAKDPTKSVNAITVAVDSANQVAVGGFESTQPGESPVPFGFFLDGKNGALITEFSGAGSEGLTFGTNDHLYAVATTVGKVTAYKPVHVAELDVMPPLCTVEAEVETNVPIDCILMGNVDPWGVPGTEVWFEWDKSPQPGEVTPSEPISVKGVEGEEETLVPVEHLVVPLMPNETYYVRVGAYDKNVRPPEQHLSSQLVSFVTPYVGPKAVGSVAASFIGPFKAVLRGEFNAENADTHYYFEYAPELEAGKTLAMLCPAGMALERSKCEQAGVTATGSLDANAFGVLSVTQEARGLRPGTAYLFRLRIESVSVSHSEALSATSTEEGKFTTASQVKAQAVTGGYEQLTSTSVVIFGMVDPGGEPATVTFELGVDKGSATRLAPVFSSSVGPGASSTPESLALTDLQPATNYTYRIKVDTGFETATGQTASFITSAVPLPPPLTSPPILSMPSIPFPDYKSVTTCKHKFKARGQKCVKAKKVTKRARKRRMAGKRR